MAEQLTFEEGVGVSVFKVFYARQCHYCLLDAKYDIMLTDDRRWVFVCTRHLMSKIGRIEHGYTMEVIQHGQRETTTRTTE